MTRNDIPSDEAAGTAKPTRQRIAKLMARVGLCSRRDAEAWIAEGRVSVNGTILTSPAIDVGSDDEILVDGAPLPKAQKTRLFLFHKPRGLVTSDNDPEGRATIADYLRHRWPEAPRLVTVGRLDINTEGLLLLTNDGGLARILELPKTGWVRRYRVRAKGETDQAVLDRLREGVTIDGIDYAGIEATLDRVQGANVWLTMGLREGKNREVKRLLESIGLEVNRLIRLSFGPFQLGDLPEGSVEEVRTRVLRDQLGPTLAAAAGAAFEEPSNDSKPGRQGHREPREKPRQASRHDASTGDRPRRRPSEDAPPPRRERPTPGTRKHVSALRATRKQTAQHGPRRRVERSDLTDRRDRAVHVERVVDARSDRRARERRPLEDGGLDARRGRTDARTKGGRRPHASPSALAKRARVAKSTGTHEAIHGHGQQDATRPHRHERPDGKRPSRERSSATRRSDPAERHRPRSDDKPFEKRRTDAGDGRRTQKRFARTGSKSGGGRGGHDDRAGEETRRTPRPSRVGALKRPGSQRPRPPRGSAPRRKR